MQRDRSPSSVRGFARNGVNRIGWKDWQCIDVIGHRFSSRINSGPRSDALVVNASTYLVNGRIYRCRSSSKPSAMSRNDVGPVDRSSTWCWSGGKGARRCVAATKESPYTTQARGSYCNSGSCYNARVCETRRYVSYAEARTGCVCPSAGSAGEELGRFRGTLSGYSPTWALIRKRAP